ncbi:MAG: hypothetical protein CVV13_03890 [Gammaproteobacteria bacterium HGW-Gammaproteobacteria-3]|nr:MAG: hypothetical protein CVV13_03890 [Gammaproteobacteria bacterium HGW-Gammaproteobacteria-3]
MTPAQKLPFAMTTESVAAWLDPLNRLDTLTVGHKLYSVLKKLERIELGNEDLAASLDQLTPFVLHLSGNLNATLIASADAQGFISRKSRKPARLSAQIMRSLALIYCNAISRQDLDPVQKAQTLFTALQLFGLCLKTYTLISESVPTNLWQKIGELYRIAARDELLNSPITCKIPLFKQQKTILAVLKRNLLYALFDLYRVPVDQQAHYYAMADRSAENLDFTEEQNPFFNFYWDTLNSRSPQPGQPLNKDSAYLIFNTLAVTKHLQEILPSSQLNDPGVNPVWQKLTGYWQIIDSVSPSQPLLYSIAIGLDMAIERIRQHNRLSNIHRLSGRPAGFGVLHAMELVPLEHQKRTIATRKLEEFAQMNSGLKPGMTLLLPAKNPQFFWAQIYGKLFLPHLPVLLYTQQECPQFGIIRSIQNKQESGNQAALIETLPGLLVVINIALQTASTEAIVIKQPDQNESIILAPENFKTGDAVYRSDQPDKAFYLSRLIEANDHFRHYQLASD